MPELLVEVGCEELPATFVRKAYSDLRDGLATRLKEAGVLEGDDATALGTPRRLIVSFTNLKERQPDVAKEQRGPAMKAAYDADGNPTPALLGFCRSNGVEPAELRNDGQYVWVNKTIVGRPTAEILAEVIPQAIRALSFDKTMRWGSSRMRFARPIRWILAAFGGQAVAFDVEGVQAGTQSRGHRFYAPEAFEAKDLKSLLEGLRQRKVEPDAEKRREMILEGVKKVATGTPDLPESLIDENTFLTEWPTPLEGQFRKEYLELPAPVLVTAMAKHEKMFPVRDAGGNLIDRFIFVRNSGEDETVRKGNEWVLNARFNDAKFFHDEDRKSSMDDFLEKTSGIVFQEKLGTVRQRADRLSKLCEAIAEATGAPKDEQVVARNAGLYAKADLATGLVSELTSLQGVVGAEYAAREGMLEEVCWAIRTQYDPGKNPDPQDGKSRTAVRLVIADQLDKLAGYLGLGLEPTGSSDPFGLRRAVTQLIEAAWNWPGAMPPYDELLTVALGLYREQGVQLNEEGVFPALADIFASRYGALLPEVRYDILDAAILREYRWEATIPQGVRTRIDVLQSLVADTAFVQTATRPLNIVAAAKKKGIDYAWEDPLGKLDVAALDSVDGAALYTVLKGQEDALFKASRERDAAGVAAGVKALAEPINRFFDTTMVMAEQEDVRYARLSLMHAASLQLLTAGDFSKLVQAE